MSTTKDILYCEYENNTIRVVTVDGEPWFVAKEVCALLEVGNSGQTVALLDEANSRQAAALLDKDDNDYVTINDAMDRARDTAIVNESWLYSLIEESHKPQAHAFKHWITSVVIPYVRKTGGYSVSLEQPWLQ